MSNCANPGLHHVLFNLLICTMSKIKQASVIFTVPYADQENFFSCLSSIVPYLQYVICELKDLQTELRVLLVFKPIFSVSQITAFMDNFIDHCEDHYVCLSFVD